MKLRLTPSEKKSLRKHKTKIVDLQNFAIDEMEVLLNCPPERAREVNAFIEFQQVPSIGIRFAEDLVQMGIFSLEELKGKDGAALLNQHERQIGYMTDPCVEDQFRLVVHYAKTKDRSKKWWDFTSERKAFRLKYGYPENRPTVGWQDVER